MSKYITKQGDTWDYISNKFYGSPHFVDRLIKANSRYSKVLIFESDIEILIPQKPINVPITLPPWKRED